MNTACGGVDASYDGTNVIAVIAYGEEIQVAGQSYNQDTCTNSAVSLPIFFALRKPKPTQPQPSYVRADPSTCDTLAGMIQSYCDAEDPQCCAGGTDGEAHYQYAMNYDSDALAFIQGQYESFAARR